MGCCILLIRVCMKQSIDKNDQDAKIKQYYTAVDSINADRFSSIQEVFTYEILFS